LKIAILCTPLDFHACKWAEALSQAGQEVIFICPAPDARPVAGVRVIPVNGRNPKTWDYLDFWWTRKRLNKILNHEKPDLLNALHVTPFGVWARVAGFQPVVNMVLGADVLNYLPSAPDRFWKESQNAWYEKWIRRWHKSQVRKSLEQARLNLGDNQTILQALKQIAPKAIPHSEVFTWGIPLNRWKPASRGEKSALRESHNIPSDAVVVLSPRGLKSLYHPEVILDAIGKTPSGVKIHWVVLKGNYPIPASLRDQSSVLAHSSVSWFAQTLEETVVQDLFRLSDVMVSLPVYDGLSASLLQAFACKLIPVVSDIDASRELQKAGLGLHLLRELSSAALINILVTCAGNAETNPWSHALEKNYEWVQRHASLEIATEEFLHQMDRLLSNTH
jgi:glycosyltransferase involved in cell wall biosynthesis